MLLAAKQDGNLRGRRLQNGVHGQAKARGPKLMYMNE
jgi:hypothetical protein